LSACVLHGVSLLGSHLNINVNYFILFSLAVHVKHYLLSKYNFIKVAVASHGRESVVHMGARGVDIASVSANCFH